MTVSYDPNKLPEPANGTQQLLIAILVELRAIRIALQEQNGAVYPHKTNETTSTPVVMQQPRKRG